MNLAQAYAPPRGAVYKSMKLWYACARLIEKKSYEVNFCWNVLIEALGRHLCQSNIQPSKVLASVQLM